MHQQHCAKTPELSAWLTRNGQTGQTLDRPLLVTVMGRFNSGKVDVCERAARGRSRADGHHPTTATISILRYGRERAGRESSIAMARPHRHLGQSSGAAAWARPAEVSRIRVVEVLYPLEVLQRVNVVDTPGLQLDPASTKPSPASSLPRADAVIWLFTVRSSGQAGELEALHSIRSAGEAKILGVLNKIDRLPQMTIPQTDGDKGEPTQSLDAILSHLRDRDRTSPSCLRSSCRFRVAKALTGRRQKGRSAPARCQPATRARGKALEGGSLPDPRPSRTRRCRCVCRSSLDKAKRRRSPAGRALRSDALERSPRLLSADALLFARDVLPAERKAPDRRSRDRPRIAAHETLSFGCDLDL